MTFVEERTALFILGDLPFSEWDNYVSQVNGLGVDQYVELVQKSYDLMYK